MHLKLPLPSDVQNKRVLVRFGFDVPIENGVVTDDLRIKAALPTLQFLLTNQSKIVIMAHLGRPAGTGYEAEFSLKPVAEHLAQLLGKPVQFCPSWGGDDQSWAMANQLQPGQIMMIENLRFSPGEEENNLEFAKCLAQLGEVYINDAFSVSHRAHASVAAVTQFLPSFAGMNLNDEVKALSAVRDNPQRPLVVVIGGAKISDKVEAVVNLAHLADVVLIGGGIANNFLKADGLEINKSYVQDAPADLKKKGIDYIHVAQDLLDQTKTERVWVDGFIPVPKILYPLDVVAAASPEATETQIIDLTHNAADTPHDKDLMYLDIGPKTIQLYQELIKTAGTVFWNGPLGMFEKPAFEAGTKVIAQSIANVTNQALADHPDQKVQTILGGGDTLAAIDQFQLKDRFSFVSTAGGASLEFLAGKELPGLKAVTTQ